MVALGGDVWQLSISKYRHPPIPPPNGERVLEGFFDQHHRYGALIALTPRWARAQALRRLTRMTPYTASSALAASRIPRYIRSESSPIHRCSATARPTFEPTM